MADFFDVVLRQRACRAFLSDAPDDALVERVLEAATFAPSAENKQPWVFVVVRDHRKRAAIGDLYRRAWEGGAKAHSESRLTPTLLDEVDKGAQGGIAAAPVLVVVGGDTRVGNPRAMAASVFPAVENMLLAAGALGLGTALTTLALVFSDELAKIVGFPIEVQPIAVVPLGWPAWTLGRPSRHPVAEKTHRDTYGSPW
jgi:nitroreductase